MKTFKVWESNKSLMRIWQGPHSSQSQIPTYILISPNQSLFHEVFILFHLLVVISTVRSRLRKHSKLKKVWKDLHLLKLFGALIHYNKPPLATVAIYFILLTKEQTRTWMYVVLYPEEEDIILAFKETYYRGRVTIGC